MSLRDQLIEDLKHQPQDVLERVAAMLRDVKATPSPRDKTGYPVGYWDRIIGAFAGEEWERPNQGTQAPREEW